MQELIEQSAEIIAKAEEQFSPYAKVLMISGGNDSLTALSVCEQANVKLDALMHIHTGTGIQETTDFVRQLAEGRGYRYIEASAGTTFDEYVDRKGFHGKGTQAHALAYQLVKATNIRKAVSANIRQGKRNRPVFLLNGVRRDESDNRKRNYSGSYYDVDPGATSNIWINHIWHWDKPSCLEHLKAYEMPRNPVVGCLHRSAECMCGTMQSEEDRRMAAFFYPEWGKWLKRLDDHARRKHGWGWGENRPEWIGAMKAGQLGFSEDYFMPMCRECQSAQAIVSKGE